MKCKNSQNRYKLAQIALKINDLVNAEKALLNNIEDTRTFKTKEQIAEQIPNGAAGYFLMGLIYERRCNI